MSRCTTGEIQSGEGRPNEEGFCCRDGIAADDFEGGRGGDGWFAGGGGGGGGWFGGGGGATGVTGGGGGGGSGTYGNDVTDASGENGARSGDGKVVVEFRGDDNSKLTVTSPNGGESWKRGTTHTIQWDYDNAAGEKVKISLTRNNKFVRNIIASRPIGKAGHGSFNWTVPNDLDPGGNYKIRVNIKDDPPEFDSSDRPFTIT